MKVLVASLESRIAPHLKQMTSVKWAEIDEIGDDTSHYMQEYAASGIARAPPTAPRASSDETRATRGSSSLV